MNVKINILTKDIYSRIRDDHNINVVLFTASWCDSCKMVYPVLQKLSQENLDKVSIYIVDIDNSQDLVDLFQVYSIPTIVIFKDNKIYRKESGYRSLDVLHIYIDEIKQNTF